ncbi:MAG TPA: GTPase HflX [Desulfosalsimonadaceae bacterium]|nr:GTPase HflX [Desulfosalsimonadaceae bacterium]
MKKIFGNTNGLKAVQIKRIETLYHHRISPEAIISEALAEEICAISHEIRRQVGLLINRSGKIDSVIIGDHQGIMLPDTSHYKAPPGRLKGLRCVHTHLKQEPLTPDDLTDLALLRLDLMGAITLSDEGVPGVLHLAHIFPGQSAEYPYEIYPPKDLTQIDINCTELIKAIEDELSRTSALRKISPGEERAILISVTSAPKRQAQASIDELKELARSSGIHVLDTIIQQRKRVDPKYLMGRGKVEELTIYAMQQGATLIVFDQELNPSQIRSITDKIEFKVIDRTQLILDIFAQRAQSREGKLQVELAQLKYLLPRLVTKNTAMSRLTGGIGGRGPGETKLEINRRRVRDKISRIEKELSNVIKQRQQQKSKREKKGLPVISIIGYTNAGKSTLLNTLTRSEVLTESRLFATLDPSSRRLKFPQDTEVIITDTVGFIKDLPKELKVAFRATLEELESADLLLHVIDAANPDYPAHIESVEKILSELELERIPQICVFNKMDLIDEDTAAHLVAHYEGSTISATDKQTLMPLIEKMASMVAQAAEPVYSAV